MYRRSSLRPARSGESTRRVTRRSSLRDTAATATREYGLIIGTSYLYKITGGDMVKLPKRKIGNLEIEGTWDPTPSYGAMSETSLGPGFPTITLGNTGVGDSTGRQTPIRIWRNQGGLYRVDPRRAPAGVDGLLVNRKPGGEEFETYWRTLSQVFVDAAGRVVLVDAGSVWQRQEDTYIRPAKEDRDAELRPKRTFTSTINGGIFLLHPDGGFEDLTFKTPARSSGPMRRPTGAAQWSDDTYIVADPEMHAEGINGSGGLLLLKLDGSREARWPFGYRLKPTGVAILRGAGAPAEARPTFPVRIADLAGNNTAGPITRIESVSLERKPEPKGGSLLPPLIINWDPQQEGTPLVMQGKITVHEQTANASAGYQHKSLYDTQVGSLDARLYREAKDHIKMNVTVNVFTNTERLKGTFEQTMPTR